MTLVWVFGFVTLIYKSILCQYLIIYYYDSVMYLKIWNGNATNILILLRRCVCVCWLNGVFYYFICILGCFSYICEERDVDFDWDCIETVNSFR